MYYREDEHISTPQEAMREYAANVGREQPDVEWIGTPYDTWEQNPYYDGERGPHPEDSRSWLALISTMKVTQEHHDKIMAHAHANWGKDGWDMVYECMELNDLQRIADKYMCQTFDELLCEVKATAALWLEVQEDI